MSEIQIDPLHVISTLGRLARNRSHQTDEFGLLLWSKTVWGPSAGSNLDNKLVTANIILNLCTEIKKPTIELGIDFIDLWASEITKPSKDSTFLSELKKIESTDDRERSISVVSEDKVRGIIRTVQVIINETRMVSDKEQASIYFEIADYLTIKVLPIINRSVELDLWLMRPELLSNIGANLLTYGMCLSAIGNIALAERVSLVALSTASLIAGIVDPSLGLSLGAGSVLFSVSPPTEIIQKLFLRRMKMIDKN
ncbi:MAG: hypothetical protein HQL63_08965 [Magnetococcales bacterium]|nr:hypothetical protein [Magnetococcales bacterium]